MATIAVINVQTRLKWQSTRRATDVDGLGVARDDPGMNG
jgi:hypothetical protein